MALSLTAGRGAVTFTYVDDNLTASWTVKADDGEEKLIGTMKRVIAFVEGESAAPALPARTPGVALEMTQMTHPPMVEVTEEEGMALKKAKPGSVVNGWAAYAGQAPPAPEIPARLANEVEMIPPEEQE
ncbi:hypothetical protein OG381_34320 [Streptomyces sp. NBC_00490]|uniref:hypothetical protein n=1 Tax=Streptomyces sp. NBC_00490 TaxID=2903657 RepID=UPI002E1958F5